MECEFKFDNREETMDHMENFHGCLWIRCNYCDFRTMTLDSMKNHALRIHKKKPQKLSKTSTRGPRKFARDENNIVRKKAKVEKAEKLSEIKSKVAAVNGQKINSQRVTLNCNFCDYIALDAKVSRNFVFIDIQLTTYQTILEGLLFSLNAIFLKDNLQ